MAGIYIHIPYCRQACHYCNFHFSVSHRNKPQFLDCLVKEIEIQKGFFSNGSESEKTYLDTIYLGGGTPSVLRQQDLIRIFERLSKFFDFDRNTEVTIEANPDDLTYEKLLTINQTPINRLSVGIQSFHYPDLEYMNRIHSPCQALQAIKNAQKVGFENISVDLIYGTPTMNDRHWEKNLMRVIDLEVPHISAYALTVEDKTPLEVFIRKGKMPPVEEEQTARQFHTMLDILAKYGYEQYEISNFSKPGFYSRHNLSYWNGQPYLGLGPSAHSFRENSRSWNIANTSRYIQSIEKGELPMESETLSEDQRFDEYVMTSLRTSWGCNLDYVEETFGEEKLRALRKSAARHIRNNTLKEENGRMILTTKGKFLADGIASDLFI